MGGCLDKTAKRNHDVSKQIILMVMAYALSESPWAEDMRRAGRQKPRQWTKTKVEWDWRSFRLVGDESTLSQFSGHHSNVIGREAYYRMSLL